MLFDTAGVQQCCDHFEHFMSLRVTFLPSNDVLTSAPFDHTLIHVRKFEYCICNKKITMFSVQSHLGEYVN